MAMLTVYCDESGMDGRSPIVAVGGYISTVELWDEFEREWKEFEIRSEIPTFHATDMLNLYGDFTEEKGWNNDRVKAVFQEADNIIEKYTLAGIVAYTHIAECEKIYPSKNKKMGKKGRKQFTAEYALAGTQVIIGTSVWARENGYKEPIQFVFEWGAHGRGILEDVTKLVAKTIEGKEQFLIGGISFQPKGLPQLYPADKLINEACGVLSNYVQDKHIEKAAIDKLIKSNLRLVYRMDGENLPLLAKRSKAFSEE